MMQGRGTEILFYTRRSEKKVPDKVSKEYEKNGEVFWERTQAGGTAILKTLIQESCWRV